MSKQRRDHDEERNDLIQELVGALEGICGSALSLRGLGNIEGAMLALALTEAQAVLKRAKGE